MFCESQRVTNTTVNRVHTSAVTHFTADRCRSLLATVRLSCFTCGSAISWSSSEICRLDTSTENMAPTNTGRHWLISSRALTVICGGSTTLRPSYSPQPAKHSLEWVSERAGCCGACSQLKCTPLPITLCLLSYRCLNCLWLSCIVTVITHSVDIIFE